MATMRVGVCRPLEALQPSVRAQLAPTSSNRWKLACLASGVHAADGTAAAAAALAERWRQRRQQAGMQQWPLQQRAARQRSAALQVEAPSESMAPEAAWALLEEFTAKEARGLAQRLLDSPDKRRRLRDALLVAAGAPHAPAGWNPEAAPTISSGSSDGSGAGSGEAAGAVPEVLLGVVASDVRLAVRSLRDYCQALGLPFRMPESRVPGVAAAPAITGAVYIKYNSSSGLCYTTRYEGRDRGVLVQLGQRQLGHLPLGLHDEGMARPPPPALG